MSSVDFTKLSDDALFAAMREQVNKSRFNVGGHDRVKTRALAAEMRRRGWMEKDRPKKR